MKGMLTRREFEVFELVAKGLQNRDIAVRLRISKRTVEFHRANLMLKLNVRNAAELVRVAVEHGY